MNVKLFRVTAGPPAGIDDQWKALGVVTIRDEVYVVCSTATVADGELETAKRRIADLESVQEIAKASIRKALRVDDVEAILKEKEGDLATLADLKIQNATLLAALQRREEVQSDPAPAVTPDVVVPPAAETPPEPPVVEAEPKKEESA